MSWQLRIAQYQIAQKGYNMENLKTPTKKEFEKLMRDYKEYNENSGTITAEYIDVNLDIAKEQGFRYVIASEFIFSRADDYDDMQAWSGVQLLSSLRTEKKGSINLNDYLFKMRLAGKFQSHCALAIDLDTKEIVIIDQYSEEQQGINVDSMAHKMESYKKLYFNASDFKENMYDFLSMYCEANEYKITEDIEDADIICSYDDYEDIKEGQEMFNISNDIQKIIGLLGD